MAHSLTPDLLAPQAWSPPTSLYTPALSCHTAQKESNGNVGRRPLMSNACFQGDIWKIDGCDC